MHIIIDRKKKRQRLMMDSCDEDVLGIKESQRNKANEVEYTESEGNPIDKFLCMFPHIKLLIGKRVWAVSKDGTKVIEGVISMVYPGRLVHIKDKGVVRFDEVVAIGE